MKFEKKYCIILLLCIFLFAQSYQSKKNKLTSTNKYENSLNVIKNELDNLISNLDGTKLEDVIKNEAKKNKNSDQIVLKDGKDFSENVLDAFQSLNHDFLEFENLIDDDFKGNKTEEERLKELYYDNDHDYSKYCNLHNPNTTNSSKNSYYEDVTSLTKQIDRTVLTLSKLDKNQEKENDIKDKVELIEKMKHKLSELELKIKANKNSQEIVHSHVASIRKEMSSLLNLYQKYLSYANNLKEDLTEDLEDLKEEFHQSGRLSSKMYNNMYLFNKIQQFYFKLNVKYEKKPLEENRYKLYSNFVNQINTLDGNSGVLKNRINTEVEKLSKIDNLSPMKRIRTISKLENVLTKLRSVNTETILLKKNISNNLKKFSFSSLQDLMTLIKNQKQHNIENKNKLLHFQNAIDISTKIFKDRENIYKIKSNIMNNLERAHSNIKQHQENIESIKEQLANKLQEVENRKRENINEQNALHIRKALIERFLTIYMYTKQLKKTRKIIHNEQEYLSMTLKIKRYLQIMRSLRQMILNSKLIIDRIRANSAIQNQYQDQYDNLVNNVKVLRVDLNENSNNVDLENLRVKLLKLSQLYTYLKKGSVHNFIRNQLMNKLVNMNSSLLNKFDINKLRMQIKLS